GPPFQGGLFGLAAYELGARAEPTAPQERHPDWPDLAVGLYPMVLAFDHLERRVFAIGRGADAAAAAKGAGGARAWLDGAAAPAPFGEPAESVAAADSPEAYEAAVA